MINAEGNSHLNLILDSKKSNYQYDYADNPIRVEREITAFGNTQTIIERTHYDHVGRVTNTYHQHNSGNEEWLSSNAYTVKDELMNKKLGVFNNGNSYLQKTDYQYLTNGFLQYINPTMEVTDLFKLELNYDQGFGTFAPAQKNGNISQLIWQVKGKQEQTYGFEYDFLNRLTKANSGTYTPSRTTLDPSDYGTAYRYDARGNMMTLERSGVYNNGSDWLPQSIDDLAYDYYPNSNKIKTITDGASCPDNKVIQETVSRSGTHSVNNLLIGKSKVFGDATVNYQAGNKIELEAGFSTSSETGGRFTAEVLPCPTSGYETAGFVQRSTADLEYDENGNLKLDPHKKMQIEYNYLNLPYTATSTDDNGQKVIEWVYDANGTKLQKIVKLGSDILSTQYYIEGIEYRDNTLEAIYTAEGRLYFADGVGRYEYTLSDHLGNNRVTFSDLNGNNVIEEATELLQENHFYPFGLEMKGNFVENTGRKEKYLFNGNELQDDFGLNTYDFVNRMYDPAVGRFWQIDKLAEDPMQIDKSPFAYGWNNPVRYNDPDGNCPNCVTAGIGAVVGGAISIGFSIYNQVQSGEDISISKTLIDGAAGAVSGAVIGSGAGLVGAVGANSAAGGVMLLGGIGIGSSIAGDVTQQGLEIANNDRESFDLPEIAENATIAGPLNIVGGIAGQGLKQAATSAIKKGVTRAVASRSTIKAAQTKAAKSLGNATKGEIKNARRHIKATIKQRSSSISNGLGTAAQETINATVMGAKKAIAPELKHENND